MKRREPERAAQHARASRPRASGARSSSSNENPRLPADVLRAGAPSAPSRPRAASRTARTSRVVRQLGLLLSRYWKVKIRDRAGAAIMFLQAPIIGVMLAFVFGGQKEAVPFWCLGALQELVARRAAWPAARRPTCSTRCSRRRTTRRRCSSSSSAAVWFGTSQRGARDRDRAGDLPARAHGEPARSSTTCSRSTSCSSFFCVVQCTMLLGIVFFALGFNGGPHGVPHRARATSSPLAMNATALGLLAVDGGRVGRGGDGAHADRAHPAGRPRRADGADDDEPDAQAAHVRHAGALGLRGRDRAASASRSPATPAWIIDLHKPDLTSPPDFIVRRASSSARSPRSRATRSTARGASPSGINLDPARPSSSG